MKITLKELRTMIQESVVKALKEQEGPPNPLLDPWAGNQGVPQARRQVPGQTTAPTATPVQTPAQTGQRQTGSRPVTTSIRELIYSLASTIRNSRTAQQTINLQSLNFMLDKMKNPNVENVLSNLPRNTDIIMVNKQNEAKQVADSLRKILRTRVEQNNASQTINSIRIVLRDLRNINQALGSQDAQTDQMISQLAAVSSSPQFAERPGQAPGQLAGSQVVPVGYRPEGAPPQERPVMASAMQEKRTKKR